MQTGPATAQSWRNFALLYGAGLGGLLLASGLLKLLFAALN
ncbi:hypothetical protein [Marinobacterium aestuariivivens]|uniref:DUF2474 domain-containing protein n=1 Tax=Marinobacterium aestuariivivens TaxID=1698799 RepID=A0ABW2A2F3_9GAMM